MLARDVPYASRADESTVTLRPTWAGACDQIQIHILGRNPVWSAKTPTLVRQEIEGLIPAHYAMRNSLHEAAPASSEEPDRRECTQAAQMVGRRT